MTFHTCNVAEAFGALESDPKDGLNAEQIPERVRRCGVNAFTEQPREGLFPRIWRAATEPMIVMLLVAALIALTVNAFRALTEQEANFFEVIGVFLAIFLSVAITVAMEGRSARAFDALRELSDGIQVRVVRDGRTISIPQRDIVCGDIVSLAAGDRVPADGRLVAGCDLRADESSLTGESVPVKKWAELVLDDERAPLAERANMLFSGTYVTGGLGRLLVTAVGDATELGQIAHELSRTREERTPLQEKLARLGGLITVLGVIAAAVVFSCEIVSFALAKTLDLEHVMDALVTSIVLIVAAVPEGLPTIVAVSLSLSVIKLSRRNALVKKMIAAETIGCVSIICSDKTGTLTQNRMSVQTIWRTPGASPAIDAPPAADTGPDGGLVQISPDELADARLIENFCLNNTADVDCDGNLIGSPTEGALLAAARAAGIDYRRSRRSATIVRVFPFSSEEKHMTTVVRRDSGATAFVKGSPERVLAMCRLVPEWHAEAVRCIRSAEDRALRVLAFAHRDLAPASSFEHDETEHDMLLDGFACIFDPLRADVRDAISSCRDAGVSVKVLTGDNIATATAIARELSLIGTGERCLEACEIERMDDAELSGALPGIAVIARSTPAVKLRVVRLLRQGGDVVAVTGDGVNDAPALKHADVGIAMGVSGSEVSKEAGDIILLDDAFSTIVDAIQWGRSVYENFKRFISFQLTVNIASVATVLISILFGLGAPFTALQLLWINIIMDGPPALTLGLEPSSPELMDRAPTPRDASIIDRPLLARIVVSALYISTVFLTQVAIDFLDAGPDLQQTVLFTLFSLFQLFNAFNCRELHAASALGRLLRNKVMLAVVGATFVLQVLIIQLGGAFFGTVALPAIMWAKLFALAASIVVLSELVRLGVRIERRLRPDTAGEDAQPAEREAADAL